MGLCDAVWFALVMSRLADNEIGAEGAGRLAEPLGKLTALRELNLTCTVFEGLFFCQGVLGCCWLGLCDAVWFALL